MKGRIVDAGHRAFRGLASLALLIGSPALQACGGEGSDEPALALPALGSSVATLTVSDPAVPLPITLPQSPDPLTAGLTIPPDAPQRGAWSTTLAWPLNGLHSVLLPNGRVLTFGTPTGNAATQDGRYFDVWDPTQGFDATSHRTSYRADQVNSFCSSAAFMADGRLLVSGGNSPLESSEFSPADGAVVNALSRMADERWYGSLLTLADGRPLMLGGSTPYGALRAYLDPVAAINGGAVSMTPEIFEPGTGWRSLFGAYSREAFGPDHHRYWYPRGWVVAGGRVFGISSEKMWYLNPSGSGSITVAGDFKTGASATTRPNIGPTSAAAMFAPGRILQVGGNGYHDGHALPGSSLASVIDVSGQAPVVTDTTPMSFPRQWPSATVLPDGRVVVTGGTRFSNNGGADAVYEAELWNPATGGWTVGARAAHVRVYHSAAILMPNGAVLSTGGGAPGPVNNLNAELYFPPYFFRATSTGGAELAPRPTLTAASRLKVGYGEQLEVDVSSSGGVGRVVLLGASTVTHSFNSFQRRQELAFEQRGARLAIGMPATAPEAPPGYYLLVVLDAAGVPSTGLVLALGSGTAPPPVPTRLPRGNTVTLWSVGSPDYAAATDAAGLGVLKLLGQSPTPADLQSAEFTVRDGLADSNCVSLELATPPAGRWLRHQGYRLRTGTNDGSDLFKGDATFCAEAGLAGSGVTLRSKNFPERVLRHRDGQLWLDVPTADAAFAGAASFLAKLAALTPIGQIAAPPLLAGATASYSPSVSVSGATFTWSFGDGTSAGPQGTPNVSHAYATPGVYLVTFTVRTSDGRSTVKTFAQAVHAAPTTRAPRASTPLAYEPRTGGAARVWVVNPDNNSVAVFDAQTNTRTAEVAVGAAPRSLAIAPDGRVWVTNRDASSISIVSPTTLAVTATLSLPRAAAPHGLVFAADGSSAFVALEGAGSVLKLDPSTGAVRGSLAVGPTPRHLSISADGARLLVSRFVSAPLAGEATASPLTNVSTAEVRVVSPASFTLTRTITLAHSTREDTPVQGRGVPNYLGPALISPDGRSAWVPSKQDNVARGSLRDGLHLDFQNTVRAISSRIDLATLLEDPAARVDHDDASVASAATFHPSGAYLFVSLETSRQVAVVNPFTGSQLFRLEAGLSPQGLVVSPDGTRLYVTNFMDRTLGVYDLTPLVRFGEFRAPLIAAPATRGSERLSAQVLRGKQLFYDARDPRLARDSYLSCATCHNDGGHDGRVWDLTGAGEGLRNTISLRGKAGGQSLLHFSGNFDEVQDFEGQIRQLAGGTGLMSDLDFASGTRSQPLGDRKAGRSADLDALAAYVSSLSAPTPSPQRAASGALTAAASAGRAVFGSAGCPACHNGSTYSDEGRTALRDIGTLKPSSGSRLGAALTGIDVPSLRDAWVTAPYLHDGSAPTVAAAISVHNTTSLSATDLANLAAFVQQIDATEPGFAPPSGLTQCATENGTCTLPSGRVATVYYGASTSYFSRTNVSGTLACNNATFGDPLRGTIKSCRYR
jgi:YVTN family beta-propeller protein